MAIVDLTILESGDGGDLYLNNEDLSTVSGLTNQVYLALFGGNVEQSTSIDLSELEQRFDWWGNEYLEDDEFRFNSEFERKLNQVALNSGGVSILEDAAKSDLVYLQEYADIQIEGSIPDINKFKLLVSLQEPGTDSVKISFIWDGTKNEVIHEIII